MKVRLSLVLIGILGLTGCSSTPSVSSQHPIKKVVMSDENQHLSKERTGQSTYQTAIQEAFKHETHYSTGAQGEIILTRVPSHLLTPYVIHQFFEEKVQSSEAAGLLLQSDDIVLAFMPNSPMFTAWRLVGDPSKFELVLKNMGTTYAFNPHTMTSELFKEGFDEIPNLSAVLLGNCLLNGTQVQFSAPNNQATFDSQELETSVQRVSSNREVEVSHDSNHLSLKVFLNDEDGLYEEEIRYLAPQVLTAIKDHRDSYQFNSVSVEFLAKPSHPNQVHNSGTQDLLVATIDLTMNDLYKGAWMNELRQTLAEPLDYFRYYTTVEYE